jgi:hypothetical protein
MKFIRELQHEMEMEMPLFTPNWNKGHSQEEDRAECMFSLCTRNTILI